MKTKVAIIISLIMIAALSFWIGSIVGAQRERERQEAEFRVTVGLSNYQIAEEGDMERLKGRMGILLLGSLRDYERRFLLLLGLGLWAGGYTFPAPDDPTPPYGWKLKLGTLFFDLIFFPEWIGSAGLLLGPAVWALPTSFAFALFWRHLAARRQRASFSR